MHDPRDKSKPDLFPPAPLPSLGTLLPNELHVRRKPKPAPLGPALKKKVWSGPEANAGVGWESGADVYPHQFDPRRIDQEE